MQLHLIPQPYDHSRKASNIGTVFEDLLKSRDPFYSEVWLVSAFANRLGVVRLRSAIRKSLRDGAKIHFVVGIDMHSTTIEALREILALQADSKIVKNRRRGTTFHPKIYIFEAPDKRAELFLGSSNLTEGGIYRNYEANVRIVYDLTGDDKVAYQQHKQLLSPFISPAGPTVRELNNTLITTLGRRGDVLSERQKKEVRKKIVASTRPMIGVPTSPFGTEPLPDLPPLPSDFVSEIIREAEKTKAKVKGRQKAVGIMPEIPSVTAFYMHLNRLQTPTIPGEPRIPKVARDVTPSFWGWPNRYVAKTEHRGYRPRQYVEWKPKWRIVDTSNPSSPMIENVRMYEYKESADFRFYSGSLVRTGADEFDIVRITRVDETNCTFQCELAKRGSPLHSKWESFCTHPIRNSRRRFGYA